jgi:hypothetical protein
MSIYDVFLLYETARKFSLPSLMKLCASYLYIKANPQNVWDVLLFASQSAELTNLKKACMMYIIADSKLMKLHGVTASLHENYPLYTEYKVQKKLFKKQEEAQEKDLKFIQKGMRRLPSPSSTSKLSATTGGTISRVPSLPQIDNTTASATGIQRRRSIAGNNSHSILTTKTRNTSRLRYAHSTWANYNQPEPIA